MTRVAIGHPARKCLLWDRCSALCVFIIFLALLTMLFVIRYRNSSIEGIWKTASIDQKLGDDFAKRLTGLHQSPLIDDSLLTSSEMILDQAFEKLASNIGGHYDRKTGSLSAIILKGNVNRILHTIDISELTIGHISFSKGITTPNGYFDYIKFGRKLELLGDEKIIFKKITEKSASGTS